MTAPPIVAFGSGRRPPDVMRRAGRRRILGALLAGFGVRAVQATHELPDALPQARTARVALALGGGGCRGHAHIGVLRVLERSGLRPDFVVGSSAGAVVGALYAAGMNADQLEEYGRGVSPNLLREWVFPKLGVFGGDRIRRFIEERVGRRSIESLPLRFAAIATDLGSGGLVVLAGGDLGRAVQASASIPGLLEPVSLSGRSLVDGNLCAPVPIVAARRLGARQVVAVDITPPLEEANLADPLDALYQAFSILTRKLAMEERSVADAVIAPQVSAHGAMPEAMGKALVEAGERAAANALPALRAIFLRPAQSDDPAGTAMRAERS